MFNIKDRAFLLYLFEQLGALEDGVLEEELLLLQEDIAEFSLSSVLVDELELEALGLLAHPCDPCEDKLVRVGINRRGQVLGDSLRLVDVDLLVHEQMGSVLDLRQRVANRVHKERVVFAKVQATRAHE